MDRVIDHMNPSSVKSSVAAFDNKASIPNERVAGIQAPTLLLHASYDTLQLFYNAEYAKANISGARLVRFDRGGHLVMIVEQGAIREETKRHILDNKSR